MKRWLIFPVLILACSGMQVKSQTLKRFSDDSLKFVDELTTFMSSRIREKDQPVLDEFLGYYRSGAFSLEQKGRIRSELNLLLSRKAPPSPYFVNFLKFTNLALRTPLASDDFEAWQEGFIALIRNRKYPISKLNRFLEASVGLVSEHVLYRSHSVTWKSETADFKIQFNGSLQFLLPETNLICFASRDSIMIYETSGVFDPANIKWQGEGGKVTWERAGFKPDEVFARLDSYSIDMTKSGYTADSVLLTQVHYFSEPIPGQLTDKVRRTLNPTQALFPVFSSYTNRFQIKDMYPDVNFEGGLGLQGAAVTGIGSEMEPARLKFYRNDTLKLTVTTSSFMVKGNRISSRKSSIKFMLGNDSIFHPGVAFTFNIPNREVSLYRTDDPLTGSPYFDSYHMIDMSFEQLLWKMDDPYVKFTMARGSSMGQARFKSANFFNQSHFIQMQGMDDIHPLIALRKFADWYYSDEFPVSELARWLNKPDHQIAALMVRMAREGFIYYNEETQEVTIKPQLDDFLSANAGKIDYDVINFVSNTRAPKENGRLNLNNNELTIFGIPIIHISDSQNVVIRPAGNKIVMDKDRDFRFGGNIEAGLLKLYGKNFYFNYDSFKVDLRNIDSLNVKILSDEKDEYGNQKVIPVDNSIQNITGELYIDMPRNKSGLLDFPEYPYFESSDQSYVYYEATKGIDSTLYTRDKFYYELNPFKVKDLTNLHKENLDFTGSFHGGTIFPTLNQDLTVQEDMSLGFRTSTPPEGIPAYDGKARFYDEIFLSNRGIEAKGRLEYINATIIADTFRFFPDSMTTVARDFNITPDSIHKTYPEVAGTYVTTKWYPGDDKWLIRSQKTPFTIFNPETTFSGELIMSSNSMTGDGKLFIGDAEISSNQLAYQQNSFEADTVDLKLKSTEKGRYALVANQLSASVNLAEEEGFFNTLSDTIPIELPEKNYLSAADFLVWNLNSGKMGLVNTDGRNDVTKLGKHLTGRLRRNPPTFVSLNPRSDSLNFKSDSAMYKFDDQSLTAYNVDFLEIADAKIFPAGNSLSLEKNGRMKGLRDARIIANDVHVIDAKQINIASRKNYYGSGVYKYTSKDNRIQQILFSDIKVNKAGHTHAEGKLVEADSFMLSPYFEYVGKVTLDAEEKLLDFSGGVRLMHHCEGLGRPLIAFHAMIDPDTVFIPVNAKPATPRGSKIYKGIFITNDSTHIYSTFFANRWNYSDIPIADANGFLMFDETSGEYRVASKPKLYDTDGPGNLLSLNKNYCLAYGEGKLNPGVKLGQLKLSLVGNIKHNRENNTVNLDVLMGLDFFFAPEAMEIMAHEINAIPTLKPVDMSRDTYKKGIVELVGKTGAQSFEDASILFGNPAELPENLKHTILFTQLNLVWNEETSSYLSKGPIGIGNINGIPVNRLMDGFIEIQKKRTGDMMDVFLQVDEHTWYYFGYTTGVMQSLTSNRDFLDILAELKTNDRRLKVKSGETPYIYMSASDRKIGNFRRRMQVLLEGDEPQENPELEEK